MAIWHKVVDLLAPGTPAAVTPDQAGPRRSTAVGSETGTRTDLDTGKWRGVKSIAIFDYCVSLTNPVGGCHRKILSALCDEYDFTVFAVNFDNPAPARIAFHRVPVLRRPLALLFVTYHVMAPICYWLYRLSTWKRFDLVQIVESNLSFGGIAYTHFCHRAYLRLQVSSADRASLRHWALTLNHRLHAIFEPWIYQRVEHVVVPSQGIAEELAHEYPVARDKIVVLYNPVDTGRMRRPASFDPASLRRSVGWAEQDWVLVFVALGHFERKGLPILLEALKRVTSSQLKLLVVGGQPGAVAAYRARVDRMGLRDRVHFTGNRDDVRPYLWSADAFVLPSRYEAFPLVVLEAAAAGLPVIVTQVHGVREMILHGQNGFVIDPNTDSVVDALTRLMSLSQGTVRAMGARAADDVTRFALDRFSSRWQGLYDALTRQSDGSLA